MILKYVERLKRLGFKPHEAVRISQDMLKYFDEMHLDALIDSLEAEGYVAKVQPEPDRA